MLDLSQDIHSLSQFKRHTPEFLERLRTQGRPAVLTVDGKASVIVQDVASYQKLVELAERADDLRASLDDLKAGRVSPAENMLADMRRTLDAKKRR